MTVITNTSTRYMVKYTQHVLEMCEEHKIQFPGMEFVGGEYVNGGIRGYVLVALFGHTRIKRGPYTFHDDDIQRVELNPNEV